MDAGLPAALVGAPCRVLILFAQNRNQGDRRKTCAENLARIIRDFIGTKGLAMVQIRCLRGFETKSEAFA
jgi:hypothetical protein